ncbi:MAG: hypothetical protein HKN78_12860 [Sphingomonadaceae bacterium]|nr:hypothetical protein [Sphingomonadaceae bacterium]
MRRTRSALIAAFNELVLHSGQKDIRVADIISRADIGRSTFYDHYGSAADLHMEALSAPFAILADAVTRRGDLDRLELLLDHFWENRARARDTFSGPRGDRVTRLLAEMVEERLADGGEDYVLPLPLLALQIAELALAPIRGWVSAAAPCTSADLARGIGAAARALREALSEASPAARRSPSAC